MVQNIAPRAVSRAPGELEKIAQRQLDGVEAVAEEFARGHQEQHQELLSSSSNTGNSGSRATQKEAARQKTRG